MDYSNQQNDGHKLAAKRELEGLSPLLAQMAKTEVPLPADSYFDSLADAAIGKHDSPVVERRVVKLWPMAASLAAAASVALAIIFWPTAETAVPTLSWDSLTNDELVQYALQDDELLDTRLIEDDALLNNVSHNKQFQYIQPKAENEEYDKLLWEMIDEETLMEDFL